MIKTYFVSTFCLILLYKWERMPTLTLYHSAMTDERKRRRRRKEQVALLRPPLVLLLLSGLVVSHSRCPAAVTETYRQGECRCVARASERRLLCHLQGHVYDALPTMGPLHTFYTHVTLATGTVKTIPNNAFANFKVSTKSCLFLILAAFPCICRT